MLKPVKVSWLVPSKRACHKKSAFMTWEETKSTT